ncbi:MAG: PLDc_N domain-containing protein [Verrucomicrobiae bacterium]|nr:PLDc_N domain-containing protein [Verrucomicrobiae bacterium]MCP5521678.1 PLDc_N domain-containing protein [Verrucomicrobiales bacterium]
MTSLPTLGLIGFFELLFVLPFMLLSLAGTLFWLWMLIDCLMNESSQGNDKLIWVLVILFIPVIGSLIYFFLQRPKRREGRLL